MRSGSGASRRGRGRLSALGAAALVTLGACGLALLTAGSAPAGQAQTRPNVVVIMTDDQTVAGLDVMPKTRSFFDDEGVEFTQSLVSFSLCCPSRATFLTGQYAHNHGVLGNNRPIGGFSKLDADNTLAVWLQNAGYYTALIGKYLNGYANTTRGPQPGWSEWHASKRDFFYYGADVQEGDTEVTFGSPDEDPDDPADPDSYIDDIYTTKAVDLIAERAASPQPFFLWLSYTAPHGGSPDPPESRCVNSPKPAARHIGEFASAPLPMPPSFDEADVSDKPPSLAIRPAFTPDEVDAIRTRWRCTLEVLQSVDDGVADVFEELDDSGELDNTVVVFTTDNGFMHGEHRVPNGKGQAYEEAIRVPLLIRGPGIPAGIEVSELVANTDMAPTIAALTGVTPGLKMDGVSLLPIVDRPNLRRGRSVLIENQRNRGVRTHRYTYIDWRTVADNGFEELYDLDVDPYEVDNVAGKPAYQRRLEALRRLTNVLLECRGAGCRAVPVAQLVLRDDQGLVTGTRCTRGIVRIRLDGRDGQGLASADLGLAGVSFPIKSLQPLRASITPQMLSRNNPKLLFGRFALRDGRELTLQRKLKRC